MAGGAVVPLQLHHRRARKIPLEPQDVVHLGPAPAIDRLVVIAHAAHVAMALRQQPQPQILRDIGVLILVHQDVFEPRVIVRQDIRILLEDADIVEQQVAKITGV